VAGFAEIGGVIRILMLGSPPGIRTDAVIDGMEAVEGVAGIHHAHFWQMNEHDNALDAHLVIDRGAWGHADDIKTRVKAMLRRISASAIRRWRWNAACMPATAPTGSATGTCAG
jgi:Co/Zn/Cd efflux system component